MLCWPDRALLWCSRLNTLTTLLVTGLCDVGVNRRFIATVYSESAKAIHCAKKGKEVVRISTESVVLRSVLA